MNIQDKPDYKVFASEARGGEVADFPNLERGWGETIDKTEKIPPMEWFNLIGKRADEWLLYLTQRGVAEWDAKVKYPQYAMCQLGGRFYIATADNENKNPANSQTVWVDLAKYLGVDSKFDANNVVQSTGQSTTNVMSQKAVTDAIPTVPKNTALKAPIGWWRCADTGIIHQWGFGNLAKNGARVNFSQKFPNNFLSMTISDSDGNVLVGYQSADTNGFTLRAPAGASVGFKYIAIGY